MDRTTKLSHQEVAEQVLQVFIDVKHSCFAKPSLFYVGQLKSEIKTSNQVFDINFIIGSTLE